MGRANAAFRDAIDHLAGAGGDEGGAGLDDFLGRVVREITAFLDLPSAALWQHDLEHQTANVRLMVRAGRVMSGHDSGHVSPASPMRADSRVWSTHFARRPSLQAVETNDSLDDAQRRQLQAEGVVALLSLPLVALAESLGAITVRVPYGREITTEEMEDAQSLANHAALALLLDRRATESREAAIAREREEATRRRNELLERANQVMRAAIAHLAAQPGVDAFLGEILRVTAQELGAVGAGIWLLDGAYRMHLTYEDGEVRSPDRSPHFGREADDPVTRSRMVNLHRRGEILRQDEAYIATNEAFAPFRAYCLERGIRSILTAPLFLGDSLRGALTLRFNEDRSLTSDESDLLLTLADQVALAMELSRLSDEAKKVAVAEEQALSAAKRAESLAKANQVLRTSIETLTSPEALDDFLGHVLVAIARLMDSDSATVWTLDHDQRVAHLRFVIEKGAVVPAALSSHPNANKPHPFQPSSFMSGEYTGDARPNVVPVKRESGMPDAQVEYLTAMGVRALLAVPMVLRGGHLGTFTVRLTSYEPLSDEDSELIQALASHATLALRMITLAEEAKQVAVALEREQAAQRRVAELMKANEALARSTAELSAHGDLRGYLSAMLGILLEQMGEDSGTLWRRADDGTFHLELDMMGGHQVRREDSKHPSALRPVVPDIANRAVVANLSAQARRQAVVWADLATEPTYDSDEATRRYLLDQGVRALLSVPLFSGERQLGNFNVRSRRPRTWTTEQIELAQALGNQAALAMEMDRLATEAKQAAVAREREAAAREQVAELTRANAAISRTIDSLAREHSVDAFLATTMGAMAEALETTSMTMWVVRDGRSYLHLVYEDGRTVRGVESSHPNAHEPAAVSTAQFSSNGTYRRTPYVYQVGGRDAVWSAAQVDYLRSLGVRALVEGVMVVDDGIVGSFTARITEGQSDPTPARLSLVQALTNQAALALEMTRLAEQAKDAAIARERELAAEARASKLAEANRALLSTVELLAADTDMSKLLGYVLLAITNHLGARSSAVWLHDRCTSEMRLAFLVEDGVVKAGAHSEHPNARMRAKWGGPRHTIVPDWGKASARPRAVPIADDPSLTAEQRTYLEKLGVRALLAIPLVIAGVHAGTFTVRLEADRDPLNEDLELALALANQATFALRFAELAELEKRAAVEREQEHGAQERLAELARANAAMRECLDQIARATDLTELRPTVLGALVKLMGALGGSLWRFDASDGSVTLEQELANGVFHSRDTSGFAHPEKHFYSPEHAPSFEKNQRLIRGEALTMDVATSDMFLLNEREHLLSQGIETLIVLPIEAAGRHLGRLALAFQGQRALTQSEYELAKALTSQAGLVLEAARLAEQARQTAVAREQEASARARADALARISEAGRSSLARLAEQPDVDAFLGHILHVCVEQFGAVGAGIWQLHGDGNARLRLSLEDGRVSVAAQSPHPGGLAKDATQFYDHVRLPRGAIVVDDWRAIGARPHFEAFRGYLERHGIRSLVTVPMYLGDVFRGGLTVRFSTERVLSPVEEGLARSLTNQAVLALELTQLSEQARSTAVIEERNRIARDIHDSLAQGLAAIIRQLEAASMDPSRAESHLSLALDVAQGNLVDARRSIRALRPLALERASLPEALAALVADYQPLVSSAVSFVLRGQPRPIPSEVETELYGVAKEALTNAAKHAAAAAIVVEVLFEGSFVQVIVRDDGKGFDPQEARGKGVGLASIEERAARVGANAIVASEPGDGCEVILFWTTPGGNEDAS